MPCEQWACVLIYATFDGGKKFSLENCQSVKCYRWWDALINCTDVCLDTHIHTTPSFSIQRHVCVRHSSALHLSTTNNYDDGEVLRLLSSHPNIVTSFRIAVAVFVISSVLSTSVNQLVVSWRRLRVGWRRWWWGWRRRGWWFGVASMK